MFEADLIEKAEKLLQLCRARGLKLTTAESCTGGLVAALLTDIPGASGVFTRGYVVYANQAKADLLGVPDAVLSAYGAVSAEVAELMAGGGTLRAGADLGLAVTGIAGPGGGSVEKPVGLVYVAVKCGAAASVEEHRFGAVGRQNIRLKAVKAVIDLTLSQL